MPLPAVQLLAHVFWSTRRTDTSRIGLFGTSRGGLMTYLALTHTTRIKAAVVHSGISDAVAISSLRTGRKWNRMRSRPGGEK